MKTCSSCKNAKPASQFILDSRYRGGYKHQCRECINARRKRNGRYGETQEQRRKWSLAKTHGITPEDYDGLLAKQNGTCAICFSFPLCGPGRRLHIDHDHKTGVIRGLLCSRCNTALGLMKDSSERILSAAVYLITKSE